MFFIYISSCQSKRSGSSTNALLQKVSSQLKGERVKKKDDEDDALNAYIKSLSQKTAQQRGKSVEFEEMGDISISSELDTHDTSSSIKRRAVTTSGSKFLKKKAKEEPGAQPVSKFLKKPQVSSASPVPTVSEQVRAHLNHMSNDKPGQRSAALDKASVLAKKITQRSNENRKVFTLETDSESLETPRQNTDSDSFKIGKNAGKFLKKKEQSAEPDSVTNRPASPQPKNKMQNTEHKSKGSPYKLKSSTKYSTDVVLSSGEESLQDFIFGADGSDDSGRMAVKGGTITRQEFRKRAQSPHRSPSPDSKPPTPSSRTPRRSPSPKVGRRSPSPGFRRSRSQSEDSNVGDTMASDIIEEVNESDQQSASSEDVFRVNLMDADTLEPVIISKPNVFERQSRDVTKKKEKKQVKEKKKEKKDDIFSSLGIHTIEELLGDVQDLEEPRSEVSEIKTASESEEIKTERSDQVLGANKLKESRSEVVSEIKTRSSTPRYSYSEDFDSSISERIGESSKHSKIKSVSEIRTRYSDEETDLSDSIVSQSESEVTESKSTATSDRTITDSYTYSDRPPTRHDKVRTKTAEVQTAEQGLQYQWNSKYSGFAVPGFLYGLGMVDPTPIATHVVSPDSLEALTSYSPAMLALHDMLKQQLDLTRQFVESQKYLYKSFAGSMESTYRYTTLEDTKQYIKKHRPKTLTFKEAMKMVKSEMNR